MPPNMAAGGAKKQKQKGVHEACAIGGVSARRNRTRSERGKKNLASF
jgi:hypothetical protein